MKVYSRVVLDHRGDILDEDSFEYDGVVTECKGGGSSTTTNVDYEYNSRMAAVAERQQDMAEEYFDFWRTDQKGLDRQKIEAQAEILPHQTTFDIAELQSQNELLPYQTAHQKALLEAETSLVPQKTELSKQQMADTSLAITQNAPVRAQFLQQSMNGVNINDRMGQATADVAQSYKDATQQTQRGLSRMGVTPSSGALASTMNATNLARAKANAGARGTSRVNAENENYERLKAGAAYGLSATNGAGGLA